MLVHHDGRDYNVAASEAAKHARKLMEEKIEAGKTSAVKLFEHVNTKVPADMLARSNAFKFIPDAEFEEIAGEPVEEGKVIPLAVELKDRADSFTIHNHALQQVCTKAGVPYAYLGELVRAKDGWKHALAAQILNEHFGQATQDRSEDITKSRNLVRVVDGDIRAVLSDRYRRLDSRPLLEAFASGCQEYGAVAVEGVVTDTRLALKAYLPLIFEPVPNEVMMLGVEWSNSDFGAGKHALRQIVLRLWCTNKATMEDSLSQVHLGGRLAEDVEFSERTYRLDTQAQVSALKDVVTHALAPANIKALTTTIKNADEQKIDWRRASTILSKKLLKDELKAVRDAFESEDVINLPAGKSTWRMSNAISWIAGKTEDTDRRLELERLAGEVVNGSEEKAA